MASLAGQMAASCLKETERGEVIFLFPLLFFIPSRGYIVSDCEEVRRLKFALSKYYKFQMLTDTQQFRRISPLSHSRMPGTSCNGTRINVWTNKPVSATGQVFQKRQRPSG